MDGDDLDARLEAVERALTDGETALDLAELEDAAAVEERLDRLADAVDSLADRVAATEGAVEALRGYVGDARATDDAVERTADAALAKAEQLERTLERRELSRECDHEFGVEHEREREREHEGIRDRGRGRDRDRDRDHEPADREETSGLRPGRERPATRDGRGRIDARTAGGPGPEPEPVPGSDSRDGARRPGPVASPRSNGADAGTGTGAGAGTGAGTPRREGGRPDDREATGREDTGPDERVDGESGTADPDPDPDLDSGPESTATPNSAPVSDPGPDPVVPSAEAVDAALDDAGSRRVTDRCRQCGRSTARTEPGAAAGTRTETAGGPDRASGAPRSGTAGSSAAVADDRRDDGRSRRPALARDGDGRSGRGPVDEAGVGAGGRADDRSLVDRLRDAL